MTSQSETELDKHMDNSTTSLWKALQFISCMGRGERKETAAAATTADYTRYATTAKQILVSPLSFFSFCIYQEAEDNRGDSRKHSCV